MSYESVVKEDAPKGFWRLGEASGTSAVDASGNAQTGTYKGTPTLGVTGALTGDANTAITLNGTTQWVSVPDSATLDLGDVLTYECWFKRGAISTAQTLIDKGPNALIVRLLATNKILVRRNSVANICESTVTVTDTTTWHHLVVTKNGATVKIWLDGVDVTGTVTNSTLTNTAVVLGIGVAEAGAEEFWKGSLDEVAVYGTALSEARVKAHFAAGAAPTNLTAPVISGTAKVGETLSVTNGTWEGEPTGFTYQWFRINNSTGNEVTPTGATNSNTYTPQSDAVGQKIVCEVSAKNAAGSSSNARSNSVGPVEAAAAQPILSMVI